MEMTEVLTMEDSIKDMKSASKNLNSRQSPRPTRRKIPVRDGIVGSRKGNDMESPTNDVFAIFLLLLLVHHHLNLPHTVAFLLRFRHSNTSLVSLTAYC